MCGIAGVLNCDTFGTATEGFIRDAMLCGTVRGFDSTGLIQLAKNGDLFIHKKPVPGPLMLVDKITEQFLNDVAKTQITVIHHRAATQGAVTKENAHPFLLNSSQMDEDRKPHLIAGVHNGSLVNWRTQKGANAFDVDSAWALSRIAVEGFDAFKSISGPYAFVWTDTSQPGKLFIARNSGRPMHIVFSKNKKQAFFASEAGMLAWLVERNKAIVEDEMMVIGQDRIYTFDVNGKEIKYDSVLTPRAAYVAPPPAARTPINNGTTYPPATARGPLNWEGERFVDRMKLALGGKDPNAPRTTATTTATTTAVTTPPAKIDDTKIAEVAATTITAKADDEVVGQRDDDAPTNVVDLDTDKVPTAWFSDANSSKDEQALAKKWGIFRELQWFQGVTYDDEAGEVLGDIEVYVPGTGKNVYSGVLRGCSQARAHTDFIDNKAKNRVANVNGNWCVVIGAREEKQLGKVLIVAELNQRGLDVMANRKRAAH